MPPPATVRLVSCAGAWAAGESGTSEASATASAEPYTRRISCPFLCVKAIIRPNGEYTTGHGARVRIR